MEGVKQFMRALLYLAVFVAVFVLYLGAQFVLPLALLGLYGKSPAAFAAITVAWVGINLIAFSVMPGSRHPDE